jgi:uncharacterized membrane protein YjgN (DUF898 family)
MFVYTRVENHEPAEDGMEETDASESTPSTPTEPGASVSGEAAASVPGEAAASVPAEPAASVSGEAAASIPSEATASSPGGPTLPAPSGPAPEARRCRVQFTGTGGEYFGIWIVNLLLTIVTLGIYSAWAKVRKMQYFYRNTRLDGSAFDYHGNPVAILKGRLLAVVLVVAYKLVVPALGAFALIAVLVLIAAVPWLLTQSYRFRLRNSSYRGLRFRFAGPAWQAYLFLGLPMILILAPSALIESGVAGDPQHPKRIFAIAIGVAYVLLAVVWPYVHYSFKRWQHAHAFYGTARGEFLASAGDFYTTYAAAFFGMLFFGMIPVGILMALLGVGLRTVGGHSAGPMALAFALVFGLVFYSIALAAGSVVTAWIQNAVWSGTRIGGVAFAGDMRAGHLLSITLGNIVMVVFSLGLLIPFAVMRLMKFKIESIEVLDADALARFAGDETGANVGALGEGAVDVMDFDFGL